MTTIPVEMDLNSIKKSIAKLERYKQELSQKNKAMLEELGDIGIGVIESNRGSFAHKLRTKKWQVEFRGGKTHRENIVLRQTGNVSVSWLRRGQKVTVKVSPLMMTEYGSGKFAVEGHRGTFPGQTHAFQDSWTWIGLDGKQYSSSGFTPTRPMHKARNELVKRIPEVARRHFSAK